MAEELHKFLQRIRIRSTYIHSDVETLERIRILEEFQKGYYDVLIGVNLLREGLDLPQVSLVAILDADKEGFLRSERALTQTAGRAARNVEGRVIMYADKITDSMARTIRETERRRDKQMQYNKEHGITPTQIAMNVRNTGRDGLRPDGRYGFHGGGRSCNTIHDTPTAGKSHRHCQAKDGGCGQETGLHYCGKIQG